MSKIVRKTQLQFGGSAGAGPGGIGQFGSLAAAAPAFSLDPAVIQALSNYLGGWSQAVVANNAFATEDRNAIDYLYAYQLGYVLQQGVAEWDAGTTYYKGSLASSPAGGLLYASLVDTNLNHALSDQSRWKAVNGPVYDVICGSLPFCTHANIAAAAVDSNMGNNLRVLLASDDASAPTISKTGWRISSLPGVTATGAWTLNAQGIWVEASRFSGQSTAITITSSAPYCKLLFNNFAGVGTDWADSSPAGKKAVTMGNIDE